ncbi:Spc7 kinetochore protein-domain-containing protein [Geopyxis carbonaria]|nr:Spc7 kinetochore protein-domain-containing protein [Geopyxis carbonaria]
MSGDATARPRRSRKSIAFQPHSSGKKDSQILTPPEPATKNARKSRSKSLGPGGLEALNAAEGGKQGILKDGSGNEGRESVANTIMAPQVKSILKPTVPLPPIAPIPAHRPQVQRGPSGQIIQSTKPTQPSSIFQPPPQTTIPVKTEEEQQAAAKARAARRQSLGNRRVSFAPEATLHTWDVVEYYQDGSSTPGNSSVASTSRNSTPAVTPNNRRSGREAVEATPTPGAEPPSTPPEQVEHQPPETPPNARTEHQKKNRRVSVAKTPPMNFNNPDDEFGSSSPFSSSPGMDGQGNLSMDEGQSSDGTDSMDDDETSASRTFISQGGDTTMGDTRMTMQGMDTGMIDDTGAFKPLFKKPVAWRFEDDGITSSPPVPQPVAAPAPKVAEEISPPKFSFSPKTPQQPEEDDGEMTMDMTRPVGGLLRSFSPVLPSRPQEQNDEDFGMDMDETRPVGGILSAANSQKQKSEEEDEEGEDMNVDVTMDMTMDMTRPVGGILSTMNMSRPRRSLGFSLPQTEPKDEEDGLEMDMTMDMTRPIGGIIGYPSLPVEREQMPSPTPSTTSNVSMNEDMTMEFTSVLGGIINNSVQNAEPNESRRSSLGNRRRGGGVLLSGDVWAKDQAERQHQEKDQDQELDIDMTVAVGGILASNKNESPGLLDSKVEDSPPMDEDDDMSMDFTVAIGKIIQPQRFVAPKEETPKKLVGEEILEAPKEIPQPISEPEPDPISEPEPEPKLEPEPEPEPIQVEEPTVEETIKEEKAAPRNRRASARRSSGTTPIQKTTRVTRRSSARLSLEKSGSAEPVPNVSPAKAPVAQASTPLLETPKRKKTPRKNATPQRLAPPQPSTPQPKTPPKQVTPLVPVSKPQTPSKRTPKPQTSVRMAAPEVGFTLSAKKRVGFQISPSPMKTRLGPSGIGIDRIGLGSPAIASKLSRRKSLTEETLAFSPVAIPNALLKASLEDKEEEERDMKEEQERQIAEEKKLDLMSKIQVMLTPKRQARKSMAYGALVPSNKRLLDEGALSGKKRRKSADGVSSIAEEDELTMSGMMFKSTLPTPGSGRRKTPRKTPNKTPRRMIQEENLGSPIKHPEELPEKGVEEEEEEEEDGENISLGEFLEMIDISFLDGLTATKRRNTGLGPSSQRQSLANEEPSAADILIAGACTVPQLDLYQHSCRELKKYIKDGRSVIKEIESDTLEENPQLFREYATVGPSIRLLMDNQFREIKTHARLQAKSVWYHWRMQLIADLKSCLENNLNGLKQDEKILESSMAKLLPFMPAIKRDWEEAKARLEKIQEIKRRIEADDPDTLAEARARLKDSMEKLEIAKAELAERKAESEKIEEQITAKEAIKGELEASIEEAERVKEMNRGWSEEEVMTWKNRCEELEKSSGWMLNRVLPDGRLEMMFMREIKLICDTDGQKASVVEYLFPVGAKPSQRKSLPDVERDFFMAGLQAKLADERDPKRVLKVVSTYWKGALGVVDNIVQLRSHHHTIVHVDPQESTMLQVKATVLVQELRSKVEVGFIVSQDTLETERTGVRVVYGGISQETIEGIMLEWEGSWKDGVRMAVTRCLESRRRGGQVIGVKG